MDLSNLSAHFESLDEAVRFVREYEEKTNTSYVIKKKKTCGKLYVRYSHIALLLNSRLCMHLLGHIELQNCWSTFNYSMKIIIRPHYYIEFRKFGMRMFRQLGKTSCMVLRSVIGSSCYT